MNKKEIKTRLSNANTIDEIRDLANELYGDNWIVTCSFCGEGDGEFDILNGIWKCICGLETKVNRKEGG